jgi:hypothetical protein
VGKCVTVVGWHATVIRTIKSTTAHAWQNLGIG